MNLENVLTYKDNLWKEEVWYAYLIKPNNNEIKSYLWYTPILLWTSLKNLLEENGYLGYEWNIRLYWIFWLVKNWWRYNIWEISKVEILDRNLNVIDVLEKWNPKSTKPKLNIKPGNKDYLSNLDRYIDIKKYVVHIRNKNWFEFEQINYDISNMIEYFVDNDWFYFGEKNKGKKITSNEINFSFDYLLRIIGDSFFLKNPKSFDGSLEVKVKDNWDDVINIYYTKKGELDSIILGPEVWLFSKDLVDKMKEEVWKDLDEDVEFVPVKLIPKEWIKWEIIEGYYVLHFFKRLKNILNTRIVDCEYMKKLHIAEYNYYWLLVSEEIKKIIEKEKINDLSIREYKVCEELIKRHTKNFS